MTNRLKVHRHKRTLDGIRRAEKLAHDLQHVADEGKLSNRKGGGLLPSQLGWGQHPNRKAKISLFDPFKVRT